MKVWRTRFISAHVAFWKDDEANMIMALEQFQHVVEPLQQQQLFEPFLHCIGGFWIFCKSFFEQTCLALPPSL